MNGSRRSRTMVLTALVLTFALTSACGNRQPYEELRAAATGGGSIETPGALGSTGTQVPEASTSGGGAAGAGASNTLPAGNGGIPASVGQSPQTRGTADKVAPNGAATGTAPAGAGVKASCAGSLEPIRIASVGHNSGVFGAILYPGVQALQAWVKWINARGGVACHPVELFVGDDGGDPATHLSLVRKFVEGNGAVAMVFPNAPMTGQSSVEYLTQKRIPVFGSEGGSPWVNLNSTYFPQMASGLQYVETAFAMAGALAAPGQNKLSSMNCIEAPACAVVGKVAARYAAKYGLELVHSGDITITQPDYSSTCLAAKNAGANIVLMAMDGNSAQRMARSCAGVGFHPQFVTAAATITPDQAAAPILDGVRVSVPVQPWFAGGPALKEYLDAIATFAPGLRGSPIGVQAWVAGQLFAAAAEKVSAHPTSESLLAGAYTIKNNDFGGLTSPLTFKPNAPSQAPPKMCWWAVQFNGSNVSSPNGAKKTCGVAEPEPN